MSDKTVEYQIFFNSNGVDTLKKISGELTNVNDKTEKSVSAFKKLGDTFFAIENISNGIKQIGRSFNDVVKPGIDLQTSMKDLQAITGVTGKTFDSIEEKARKTAKVFGLDASQSVTSYKLLLSQLSPELAKTPEALDAMGRSASVLSKSMGGDVSAATEVLTSAMNGFGVSLDNPTEAAKKMSEMMNIMAAGAKEGSAELPNIKSALDAVGGSAKAVGVSFAETNAAIQLLDKAQKKGSEGGIALRNVMLRLSMGRFMPKDAKEGLEAAGINVEKLADKSLTLSERLKMLKPIQKDTALMAKLFGDENIVAGLALVQGTDQMDAYSKMIQNTNTAGEQASIVMSSYSEKMARMNAWFKDIGISIFNTTQGFLPFVNVIGKGLQMMTFLGGAMNTVSIISDTKFYKSIVKASKATWSFLLNVGKSTVGLLANGAVMLGSALMSLGAYAAGTLGATMATWGFNAALIANPITWVIVGIVALGAAIYGIIKYWDEIKLKISQFWEWLKTSIKAIGNWILENNPFSFVVNGLDKIFPGFKAKLNQFTSYFYDKFIKPVVEPFKWVLKKIGLIKDEDEKKPYKESDKKLLTATEIEQLPEAEQQKLAEKYFGKGVSVKELKKRISLEKSEQTKYDLSGLNTPMASGTKTVNGKEAAASTGKEVRNVSFRTDSLVKNLIVQVTNLSESTGKIKDLISEALINGMRDAELAM